MAPEVGSQAPDFTLKDQNNQNVTLSSLRGQRNVLLVFYPFAYSSICTGELCAVQDDLEDFQNEDVQILAISVDHPYALKSWAANEGFDFPLLSDFWPHGAISRAYGVFNDDHGMAVRGTFLVDKAGKVRFAEINGAGEPRDQSAWLNAVTAVAKDV
jgi:peroxiredoxin (alkyl hydroperoxide reductase subunit C)